MDKTEQQKRFEAAWQIKWPNDEPRIFEQDSKGNYTWPEVQDTFDGWQLCEASALERAAKQCDYVQLSKIEQLFAGKKMVDAGAVVLSVEDAMHIRCLIHFEHDKGLPVVDTLNDAIEQARGKNGN
jgi:hypothetical protein